MTIPSKSNSQQLTNKCMQQFHLNILIAFVFLIFTSCSYATEETISPEVSSAYGVIQRTIPGIEKHIILEKIETNSTNDVFELETKDKKVIIRGTSGVAMASGFNYYLKNYCNVNISWCGKQVNMPAQLP